MRPSEELEPLLDRIAHANIDAVLVSSSDGRLLGLLERHRAEQLTNKEATT